ncbi:MAG: hypothetical protein HDS92_01725 [Bacteroidales bacterium]|nr:hypothetical protein [Bacteroidales bacterium]
MILDRLKLLIFVKNINNFSIFKYFHYVWHNLIIKIMPKSLLLSLFLAFCFICNGRENHYSLQTVDGILPNPESTIWDFSNANIVGPEFEITIYAQDSLMRIDMPSKSYMFAVERDSIWRLWSDSRFLVLKDTIPALVAVSNRGKAITSPLAQRGKAYHRDFILTEGTQQLLPSVYGTLIFPMGDTIINARLNKNITHHTVSVSPINYPSLSDAPDSVKIHRHIQTYTWLSPGVKFPIAQMEIERDSVDNREICMEVFSWIRTEIGKSSDSTQPQMAPGAPSNLAGLDRFESDKYHQPIEFTADKIDQFLQNLEISENENEIVIRFSNTSMEASSRDDYKMIFTDILGRVMGSSSCNGKEEWRISRDNLPPGEYIIYLSDSKTSSSHKIILH